MNPISIWHSLWQLIRYNQRLYWADTILWLFIAGLPALPGLIIREFFNALTNESSFLLSIWGWIALFLGIGLARIVAIFTGCITKTQHRFTMSSLIRHNLLMGLMNRPGAEPLTDRGNSDRSVSPGAIISFFRDDAYQLENNVVFTNEIFGEAVFAVGSLVLLLSINAQITLLVFLPLILIIIILQRISDRLKLYRRASRQATQQVTSMVGEMFSAVQAIKVANAEESVLARLRQTCDRRQQLMVRDRLLTAILESSFENLVSIGTGVILLFAAWLMRSPNDSLSVGDLALFIYYLSYITNFFAFGGEFLAQTKQSEVSLERMAGLIDSEGSGITAHHRLYLKPIAKQTPKLPRIQSLPLLESDRLQDLLALNLTYCYPGTNRGITDVSLRLRRGSFTVITGQVGSGKTTLLRVLMGLLPMQSGEIYWNGQKVNNPSQFFAPPRSAYTPQVPQLFSNTLRENILLGLEKSNEELEMAIALAVFDRDLATMPNGLNTPIGVKGMRLSGGQLQRAATARMLIRQPDLLVFDDLSSALDVETEQKLWSRLFSIHSANPNWTPTYLVVSHRRSVLDCSDRIILLDRGRVEMTGTFDDLPSTYF
ncbi:ABC transporter ATP-binding protein [Hyella patelloides LEGE 07179]|uniref:ABC transporter ATP-binding protein n=1 Tax=Hyella patelloides LEGE 07179 TaxID=945734 RepID=A0A563VNY9_9CYAN|nr:ABC transporter ATP-binding protein [Hyella patelloides]VEP12995.1 ABC transporter ATP-binding protein [Hyella patelloides LEGE 07179]